MNVIKGFFISLFLAIVLNIGAVLWLIDFLARGMEFTMHLVHQGISFILDNVCEGAKWAMIKNGIISKKTDSMNDYEHDTINEQ